MWYQPPANVAAPSCLTMHIHTVSSHPTVESDGPAVVFVHGAWHGEWCWREHFLPYFAEHGHTAYAVDLRGHGRSDGVARLRRHRIADYVADLGNVLSGLGGNLVLVGHSMGGVVVQKYLETGVAAGAVLLATLPPVGGLPVAARLARRYPLAMLKVLATRSLLPLVATPARTRELFFSEGISDARLHEHHSRLQDESFRAFFDLIAFERTRAERIRVPVLVLGAERDSIITPAQVAATAAAYRTEPRLFPTAHDMMLDDGWMGVADHIIRWLADIRVSRA
jgi:pimeloyl-ACP methyl ester carboxylesterase